MRAKKPILVYCADRDFLSATAFALRLHDYDVVAVTDVKEARVMSAGKDAALVCAVLLHVQQGDPTGRLLHKLLEDGTRLPILLVDQAGDLAPVHFADTVLYGRNTKMTHILAALQILCARKRGIHARRDV